MKFSIKDFFSKCDQIRSSVTLVLLPGLRPRPTGKVSQLAAPQDPQRIRALLRLRSLSIVCNIKNVQHPNVCKMTQMTTEQLPVSDSYDSTSYSEF